MAAYKILFTITLRHDYYVNKACNDFVVKPTKDCLALLDQYRLLYRQAGNKVIILTPVEDNKPVIEISPGTVFRFYLFCDNVYFPLFTNWDRDPEDKNVKTFFATNESGNVSQGGLYLTKPLLEYDSQVAYRQGDIVIDSNSIVNESLQNNPAGTKSKPLSDKEFWNKLDGNKTQYATTNDLIELTQNLLPLVMIP